MRRRRLSMKLPRPTASSGGSGATRCRRLRTAPALFKPRFSRTPALAALAAVVLLVPVLVLPNPQDAVIAQQRAVRETADRQADRLEDLARDLESKGRDAQDPRTRLAEELRELARQLREKPDELAANLRQLGAVESEVRSRIDPATEQRASSMTSLAQITLARGDRQARREPGRRSAEDQGGPRGARRQARRDDRRGTPRAGPAAGRDAVDGVQRGRRGRDGLA